MAQAISERSLEGTACTEQCNVLIKAAHVVVKD